MTRSCRSASARAISSGGLRQYSSRARRGSSRCRFSGPNRVDDPELVPSPRGRNIDSFRAAAAVFIAPMRVSGSWATTMDRMTMSRSSPWKLAGSPTRNARSSSSVGPKRSRRRLEISGACPDPNRVMTPKVMPWKSGSSMSSAMRSTTAFASSWFVSSLRRRVPSGTNTEPRGCQWGCGGRSRRATIVSLYHSWLENPMMRGRQRKCSRSCTIWGNRWRAMS